MQIITTAKNFVVKNKTYFIIALVFLAVVVAYYYYTFKKEINETMTYITTNSSAADWKASITAKATAAGRTFEEQLYRDAKYMLEQKHKGNPILYLV